jgi:hypothetical protein
VIRMQKVQSNDRAIGRLQSNIERALAPIVEMTLLQGVDLEAGRTMRIPHMLGRPLLGWFPARVRAQCDLWDEQDNNLSPELSLLLRTSRDVVADLVVF